MRPEDVLDFWLGGDVPGGSWRAQTERWFGGGPALDAEIRARFGEAVAAALRGRLDAWAQTPRGRVALVILLDQFTRNVYRGRPEAFAGDARALALAEEAATDGTDRQLHPVERMFLYMPFMHAESLAAQERGVALFRALAEEPGEAQEMLQGVVPYAEEHCETVRRFGRFPHRNTLLGRTATGAERAYLEGGGATYGQAPPDPRPEEGP